MASQRINDLADYPRPWFYRPEVYYGLFIFPPVWSILTLRSPWHSIEGLRGFDLFLKVLIGGIAWFIIIASVVVSVAWVQSEAGGGPKNLFIFVPGVLLTLLTQVQWAAHRARHGPPPTDEAEAEADSGASESSAAPARSPAATPASPARPPRRRRRRRPRLASRSADSPTLC